MLTCLLTSENLFCVGLSGLVLSVLGVALAIHASFHGETITIGAILFLTGLTLLTLSAFFDYVFAKSLPEQNSQGSVA